MASKQELAPRESQLFKSILKHFDSKQYKKGLRCVEDILKVNPNHGETLAMKGLLLNSTGKKVEALEFVKLGLRNNITSYTCWHVYGLIHKSDRNYSEAMKCYTQALKRDPKNTQVLRDLANLQIQTRSLQNFAHTRKELLLIRPNAFELWYGYAVSLQLIGEYEKGIKTLVLFEDIIGAGSEKNALETNERKLFIIYLYDLSGNYEEGLKYIAENENAVLDKTILKQIKGEMYLKLEKFQEAEAHFRELIDVNPDNFQYHQLLQKSLSVYSSDGKYTDEQRNKLTDLYAELHEKYPRCSAIKRIPLNFLVGDKFRTKLEEYVKQYLIKGVPSLFNSLSQLYSDDEKRGIIEDVFLSYEKSLQSTSKFTESDREENPSILLWTLFFIAQHYDKLKNYGKAMEYIEQAISHTPTAIDLYLVKGKILKHQGEFVEASNVVDFARSLDLADRYLNTKATIYFLRADKVEEAEKTVELFSKDPETSLAEFQCMWYELDCGEALLRLGKIGKALTKFISVDKHFDDFIEDQFDFHSYCLRKLTLRAYSKFLNYQDKIYSEDKYFRAISGVIRSYLAIYDRPKVEETPEALFGHLTGGEYKKALKKFKREQAKKKQLEEERKELEKKKGNANKKQQTEEEYTKLEQTKDPLADVAKYVASVNQHFPQRLDTHLLSFEYYLRKQKFLLALKAINKLRQLDAGNSSVNVLGHRLKEAVEKANPADPTVAKLLADSLSSF